MKDFFKGIELTKYHTWKLDRIAKSNPVKDLLKSGDHKGDIGTDIFSIYSALIAGLALAASSFGFYYISKKSKTFSSPSATGIYVLTSSKTFIEKDLNVHYVTVPTDLTTPLLITMPLAQSVIVPNPSVANVCKVSSHLKLGTFLSISLPMPLISIASPDSRSIIITFPSWKSLTCTIHPSSTFTIIANQTYLFMVCQELLNYTWKVI